MRVGERVVVYHNTTYMCSKSAINHPQHVFKAYPQVSIALLNKPVLLQKNVYLIIKSYTKQYLINYLIKNPINVLLT